jgi:small neutral amino acid transporter SnatA (MarC family)
MLIYGIVILLAGLFSIVCAAFDFDWFMNNRRASLFVKIFKRNGARVFYIVLGIVLCIMGVAII